MKRQKFIRPVVRLLLCCLLLNFALLLTACGGGPSAAAATMHLKKTEGTVDVADGEGNDVAPAENLGLYSGYKVATEAESYAWIDLDAVKLAKMDAESAVEIVKDGKDLTVNVQTGSLFFNVTEPLADDETMEIATSSMLVGIRGTCGWMTQNSAALLEGTVTVTAGEQTVTVNAGEMAVLTEDGALEVTAFSTFSVPTFVWAEITEDEALTEEILAATGMDLSQNPPVPRYAAAMIAEELDEVLYTEWVDFAKDGNPELLVIGIEPYEAIGSPSPDRNVRMYIFLRDDIESPLLSNEIDFPFETFDYMTYGEGLYAEAGNWEQNHSWSLVEADGRQFLEIYSYSFIRGPDYEYHTETARYYGFDAAGNWYSELIHYTYSTNNLITGMHSISSGNPYGSVSDHRDCDPEDFAATRAQYRPVRQLAYSPDGVTATITAP